ncbi:MAG: Tol-Pal system protein TolB, partial [Xanthobacteraceae bacterium]
MTRSHSSRFQLTRRRALVLGALGAAASFPPRHAAAQVHIDINQGNFQPMPIAVPEFLPATPNDADTAHGITQIITSNLQRSGLFAPIDPSAYIEKITNFDAVPNFQDWRAINAQALITGRSGQQSDGRIRAEFRLWDVLAGQQIGSGQQYLTTPDNWRRLGHIISDAVYERITGNKGYFDTRIVFVDETGTKLHRIKRLAMMDQDGANVRYLTRGDELVLTPRFSPSSQEVTYMAYGQGDPRVYLLNITSGEREVVGNFPGMSFSPRFSPDGQRVIMSLQEGSNSNIFVMDLRSKATTRLT